MVRPVRRSAASQQESYIADQFRRRLTEGGASGDRVGGWSGQHRAEATASPAGEGRWSWARPAGGSTLAKVKIGSGM